MYKDWFSKLTRFSFLCTFKFNFKTTNLIWLNLQKFEYFTFHRQQIRSFNYIVVKTLIIRVWRDITCNKSIQREYFLQNTFLIENLTFNSYYCWQAIELYHISYFLLKISINHVIFDILKWRHKIQYISNEGEIWTHQNKIHFYMDEKN